MESRRAARLCALVIVMGASLVPEEGRCEAGEGAPLTVERAVALALERNLSLRASALALEEALGAHLGASVVTPHNPELSVGAGLRIGEALGVDASASLGQTFDLGRPRRRRLAAAEAGVEAARGRLSLQRLIVAARVRASFAEAVGAGQLVELDREAESLAGELHEIARERERAEAGTALEVNLAALEWAGARRQLASALQRQGEAHLELARALGLPPGGAPPLPRVLLGPPPLSSGVEALVELALEGHPDLAVIESERERARRELEVARAEGAPALTVEASYDLEDGSEHIAGLGLSLPLPLFQRNQGGIAQARARVSLSELEVEDARLAVEYQVRAAFQRYRAAREVAQIHDQEASGERASNLALLRASFEEGSVGFVEVLLVQRELLSARRAAVEAAIALSRARAELELAVGSEVR